ncbi:M36 family metallopeptidase [Streptomyces sp. SP2-10]|uniref:M36 family metallopeptidase n=1 Tax=Streptomyces sp. SP2-10 TaxID=2873385 RepID=UPI001CA63BB0|nr:M36 family metallopeptidase [Streptomyces sp. SP2-10]MBY8845954.1 M36 family metallopeptidase [Streptomyces sp. SP2-10]
MTVLIDKRDLDYDRLTAVAGADMFLEETDRVAGEVGHILIAEPDKVNRFTGHLTDLKVDGAPGLTMAAAGDADAVDYIARAKAYVSSVTGAMGFGADEPAEFEPDPRVTTTSEGMHVVSLQQMLNGIEVWGMAPKVWMEGDGTVDRVIGDTVSVPANCPAMPVVTAETALAVAAAQAAEPRTVASPFGDDDLSALEVPDSFERLTYQPRNDQPMTFAKGPFDEAIPCRLVYLYMGGDVRLAWSFTFSRDNLTVQYHALVEADDRAEDRNAPQLLLFEDISRRIVEGRVFRRNPAESGFDKVPWPLPLNEYPTEPPIPPLPGFPGLWANVEDGHVATVGNNVLAVDASNRRPVAVSTDPQGNAVFDAPQDSPEQFVINIFFFCNQMHDLTMMLGFTEEHGNFQTVNPSGQGKGADPVHAFAHPQSVPGTANMATRADGTAAVMNMGLVRGTGRHTADDGDVVIHEFFHGVSNRLVGGLHDAQGLDELQSESMGEGWSDFFALTTRNFSKPQERVVIGNWLIDNPAGIRQRPYDAHYPGSFGDIGKGPGQLGSDLDYTEIHNVGEIWCAALMELTRRVATALNSKERGYRVTWQAVIDGMKLTPKNPSFLIARDAILRALKAMKGGRLTETEYKAVREAAWGAFAKFGMGVDAFCPNASFSGCRGGTQVPAAEGDS